MVGKVSGREYNSEVIIKKEKTFQNQMHTAKDTAFCLSLYFELTVK